MDSDTAASPQERGYRLRHLRKALRFSRSALSEKSKNDLGEISEGAIKNWEYGRYGGLTEKGAKKLIQVFKQEGLDCTVEWLLYGIGEDPTSFFTLLKHASQKSNASTETIITQELKIFYQLNKYPVDCIISDDAMTPTLLPGDHVAGSRYFDKDIELTVGHPCIVQTHTGSILVRIVKMGNQDGLFTLESSNPNTTASQATIENIKLFSAAPVLWIRKRIDI